MQGLTGRNRSNGTSPKLQNHQKQKYYATQSAQYDPEASANQQKIDYLFKVRKNKNWYFIQSMKDNIRNDKLINYNHIIEEENTPGPSLSRAGTIDIKNLTNNELN